MAHPFPGNVRELRNSIERAVALASDVVIHEADQTRAAQRLGIARRTLINKMEKYGLRGKGK